ncbi:transmembrane protein 247 [Eublepharis macularius]|uniref:Transmembrane protein 247 n=1 Tax=Eublepharis macularius TaxID=481883 RepID=A0AA97KQM5_EUBMA|nr:transmembrane protein 247 [Eublepharis macularius]
MGVKEKPRRTGDNSPFLTAFETPRDPHSSSEFSNFETESVYHTDKEIQADLDHTSNLEESEFSYQGGIAEFKDIQAGIEFAVQITPLKDTKKHREKMDTPASSYIPDYMMETVDNKSQAERLAVSTQRGTSALQPETYSRMAEVSSLEGMGQLHSRQITAADLDLEKIRLDGAMTRMRYRHEDNEKRRQHEEKMERIRHQAVSRSIGQELHELLQPKNQYALFFFCFIFIHVIYTARELAFYFITKHHIFCFVIVLYFIFKKTILGYRNKKK